MVSFAGHLAATSPWLAERLADAFAVVLAVEQFVAFVEHVQQLQFVQQPVVGQHALVDVVAIGLLQQRQPQQQRQMLVVARKLVVNYISMYKFHSLSYVRLASYLKVLNLDFL